jgi:two-component system chemotaxis response regulator CheY
MRLHTGSTAYVEDALSSEVPTRILIADGDAETRTLHRQAFAVAGYEVIEAIDGRDALAKVFGYSPSLVITELTLAFVDGYALCDLLRRDPLTADVPILIVTADSQTARVERVEHAGVDGVLVKPTTPDSVLREARRLLSMPRDPSVTRAHSTARQPSRNLGAPSPEQRGIARARAHKRFATTSPPKSPPALSCPSCDGTLRYRESHIGGVSDRHPEQWDYFVCVRGCGTFQYRQRTRKVRRVD